MMRKVVYFILFILTVSSCGKKNRFSIPGEELSKSPVQAVKIQRFDTDFFAVDLNNIDSSLENLRKKYGSFVDFYLREIIGNSLTDEKKITYDFLSHPAYHAIYADVESTYTDLSDVEKELTSAFRYVNYYFPKIVIPRVYTHVSGFGDFIVADDSLVSISLDYYLGSDYKNYKYVDGIYEYMIQNLKKEKIVPDVIFWWLTTEFPDHIDAPRLLENIVYYGKIMYLSEIFLPNEPKENLMGYSKNQWKWVKNNEAQMWNYLMEHRHLFSTESIITSKYINPAPFTSFFPEDSPGRTGIWIGWQIVRSYMDKNKNVSLSDLMNNNNAQEILEKSGYRP